MLSFVTAMIALWKIWQVQMLKFDKKFMAGTLKEVQEHLDLVTSYLLELDDPRAYEILMELAHAKGKIDFCEDDCNKS